MPISIDATARSPATGAGTSPRTWAHTCAAGAKLLVFGGNGDGTATVRNMNVATYAAVSLGARVAFADSGDWAAAAIFATDSPAAGTANCTMATQHGAQFGQDACYSVSLLGAAAGIVTAGQFVGTTANPGGTVTGIQAGDWVFAILSTDGQTGISQESGTLVYEDEDIALDIDVSLQRYVATGSSQVVGWTNATAGSGWAIAYVVVRPADAAPPASSARLIGGFW